MTYPEQVLWERLRNKRLKGYKFRRQVSIGNYIVDFYCPKHRFIIEVDGDSHYEEKAIKYDRTRSKWISKFGNRIVRFSNKDVCENIEGVIVEIINRLSTYDSPRFYSLGRED